MPEELRIGLVGCGRVATAGYVPAIARTAGLRLAAAADPHPGRRLEVASGRPAFATAGELVASGGIDAVVLAGPAEGRGRDAAAAAAAGLPTLVEKPPAGCAAEARALTLLDPAPHCSFNRRFDPDVAALRSLGPHDQATELDLELRYRRVRWAPHVVADDALTDVGPHLIDLARWLSGEQVIAARALCLTESTAKLELEMGRGAARVSCATDRAHRETVHVRRGAARARVRRGGISRAIPTRVAQHRRGHPLVALLSRQLAAFADAVRGAPPEDLASAADGVAVMEVVEAARRSHELGGRWVEVACR